LGEGWWDGGDARHGSDVMKRLNTSFHCQANTAEMQRA
jgi:hypothetical protein